MPTHTLILVNAVSCEGCLGREHGKPHGMHIRPSGSTSLCAKQYDCEIHFIYRNKRMNAKSPMALAMLALGAGKAFALETKGNDEDPAMEGLARHLLFGIRECKCIDFETFSGKLENLQNRKLVEMKPLEVLEAFAAQQIERGSCSRGKLTVSLE